MSSGHTASHSIRSSSCSRIGASTASRSGTAALMWSLWPWVSTMAATRRPFTASTIGWWSWAASNTTTSRSSPTIQMLFVTSHSPPSRAKMPSVVTSSIPIGSEHHDAAEHLAVLHLLERRPRSRRGRSSPRRSRRDRAGPGGRGRSSIGKSRLGRQSPYHDDFSAPPCPNTSRNGSSIVMSGRGTPTRTTVPARSRASNAWR